MKVTIIYPCMGRIPGKRYVRSWQMEPLPAAQLAGLTPAGIDIAFFDDRMEPIPYDSPTDLVAITVETYTARRAYQIASEYRRRAVPVVMGGFHPTLVTEEVMDYAEAVVVGEAEETWPQLIHDFRNGRMKRLYEAKGRPDITNTTPDRSIFEGKNYLPFALIEAGRGCPLKCEFCSIQTAFHATQTHRGIEAIVEEVKSLKERTSFFFFVDDNIVSHIGWAGELFKALIPLNIKWVAQATITMTRDAELLMLMKESGCIGVLIGFESLNEANLAKMNKGFNPSQEGVSEAISKLHEAGIILYATFVFGYEHDNLATFQDTIDFCLENDIFMVAFNHCTPFPGTPLYRRLEQEGRLLYDKWWLDERYKYGQVPYRASVEPDVVQRQCVRARKKFYSPLSIIKRMRNRANVGDLFTLRNYLFINGLLRIEASQRENYPLGDMGFVGPLLRVPEGYSGWTGKDHG